MSEKQIPISLPLDSDGFLRRECPTCERELKWRPTPEGEQGEPTPDGGYFCPYCGVQAPPGSWWTKDQLALTEATVHNEVIKPMLDDFGSSLQRASSEHVRITSQPVDHEDVPILTETDDLRRVGFACHATEPVKVLDEWQGEVHCLICGATA